MIQYKTLVEITYKKSLNLLILEGFFFRNSTLDDQCINLIRDHFKNSNLLNVYIKIELIDAITYESIKNLIIYLNDMFKKKKKIKIKWLSPVESIPMAKCLMEIAECPFQIINE